MIYAIADVCDMFDTTNKTIAQVARHFGLTSAEVKNILLDVTDEQARVTPNQ